MSARRGNMLAITVALMFVLMVLVLGLHTSQSRAARQVTRSAAELEFRQGYEFEVARLVAKDEPNPSWLKVTGDPDEVEPSSLPLDYSKELFGTDGLPNLDPKAVESDDFQAPPGFSTYKITPKTSDQALRVFGKKFQWVVTQKSGGYAVYAPNGRVTLGDVTGWSNPTFEDERKAADAYSGVPFLVAAKSDITIQEMDYGMAYTKDGDLELDGKSAIGFKGNFPLRAYESKLQDDLETIRSAMAASTSSGNKTGEIKGSFLQTAGSMLSMLFGGSDRPGLNLEQAMQVPFPSIPGGSATVPGIFYEFWVHVPAPPDFSDFSSGDGVSEDDQKEIKRINDEIDKQKDKIKDWKKERDKPGTTQAKKDELNEKIDKARDKIEDLEEEGEDLQEKLKEDADERNDEIEGKLGSDPDVPNTREEDKDIPNTGIKGWAYGPVFSGFADFLLKAVSGDFEGLAGAVVKNVRVVHFGRKDYEPDFRFDDGFYAKATLNVPPGRTFRFNGKVEIEGDLWLQKGSVMHVGGDLTLTDPFGSNNPFKPSGKLVMEEGATLVVDGNVDLAGSSKFGSLWVCSKPGKLSPISTAILCTGSVTIPNGSYTATNLEDAALWLADKESGLNFLAEAMGVLFNDIAPNMSKIAGPFHTRQPYFASYAATFQLTIVPTPIGPIPVPSAIPLPRKNILVPVFRAFTFLYTPTMNGALGENFYTHADWWGFGEGFVPVVPKVDPTRMARALASINISGFKTDFNFEDQLKKIDEQILKKAMALLIEVAVEKLVTQVATSFLPGGGLVGAAVDAAVGALKPNEDALGELQKLVIDSTIGPLVEDFKRWIDDIRDQVEDGIAEGYLREVNGPLIYANTISFGEDGAPRLAAGMLVAKNDITIGSRDFVGSLVSIQGNIEANNVYFTPQFTRASLYKPKPTSSNWLTRVVEYQYGKNHNSNDALGIQTTVKMIRTEGWSK